MEYNETQLAKIRAALFELGGAEPSPLESSQELIHVAFWQNNHLRICHYSSKTTSIQAFIPFR